MVENTKVVFLSVCLMLGCTYTQAFLITNDRNTKLNKSDEIRVQINSMRSELGQLVTNVHHIETAISQLTHVLETNIGVLSKQRRLLCADGWTRFADHCYYYSIFRKNWYAAHSTCGHFGGHLASIENMDEDGFIEDFIHNSKMEASDWAQNYTWLGGFDLLKEGHWLWVTGKPINMSAYTNWRVGNPSNGRHGKMYEDCMDWSGGGWNDNNCYESFNFVCEKII